MDYKIEEKKGHELFEKITELEKLLTERISDMHEVPGMMQARHAYIYYRLLLWGIRDFIKDNMKEIKTK